MKSTPKLIFRNATPSDVSAVVELVESAYRGEASRAGWTTEADLLDGQRTDEIEIREIIGRPQSRIRVAEQPVVDVHHAARHQSNARLIKVNALTNRAVVACVRIENAGDAGYIGMVSVRPTLQNLGVGRQLLDEAERLIRDELHLQRARMTVIGQRETLIAWYERRGYSVTGKREQFPYGQPRAGTPRRDDLYFEVLEKILAP